MLRKVGLTGGNHVRAGAIRIQSGISESEHPDAGVGDDGGAAGRGTGALHTYLPALLVDRYGISVSYAAVFLSAYTLGGITGSLAMGWLADRTSPRLAVRLDLLLSAVCVLLILRPVTPGLLLGAFVFSSGFFIHSRGILLQTLLLGIGPEDVRVDTLLSVYSTMAAVRVPFGPF